MTSQGIWVALYVLGMSKGKEGGGEAHSCCPFLRRSRPGDIRCKILLSTRGPLPDLSILLRTCPPLQLAPEGDGREADVGRQHCRETATFQDQGWLPDGALPSSRLNLKKLQGVHTHLDQRGGVGGWGCRAMGGSAGRMALCG